MQFNHIANFLTVTGIQILEILQLKRLMKTIFYMPGFQTINLVLGDAIQLPTDVTVQLVDSEVIWKKKAYCSAVFLHLPKASDKVWHKDLLFKIKHVFPHNWYLLLKSYLSDRFFHLKFGLETSWFHPTTAGVSLRRVLGPLLFLLFTADLLTTSNTLLGMFADDTARPIPAYHRVKLPTTTER